MKSRVRPFTLPQICRCGAEGRITFAPRPPPLPGEPDPDPAIVADGAFDLEAGRALVCLVCGQRLGPRPA